MAGLDVETDMVEIRRLHRAGELHESADVGKLAQLMANPNNRALIIRNSDWRVLGIFVDALLDDGTRRVVCNFCTALEINGNIFEEYSKTHFPNVPTDIYSPGHTELTGLKLKYEAYRHIYQSLGALVPFEIYPPSNIDKKLRDLAAHENARGLEVRVSGYPGKQSKIIKGMSSQHFLRRLRVYRISK